MAESTANRCLSQFWEEMLFALYSPFALCFAAGKMDTKSLRHYISQNRHILEAYVEAYKKAEGCAVGGDDKAAMRFLQTRVMEKMFALDKLLRDWGYDLPEKKKKIPDPTTVKYANFLNSAASGEIEGNTQIERSKIPVYALAAIVVSMRVYGRVYYMIGNNLSPAYNNHDFCKRWVENYTSQDFKGLVLRNEALLDKFSASLTGYEMAQLETVYHQAMKLQVECFAAELYRPQRSISPLIYVHGGSKRMLTIFCAFDTTCAALQGQFTPSQPAQQTSAKAFDYPRLRAALGTGEDTKEQANARAVPSKGFKKVFGFKKDRAKKNAVDASVAPWEVYFEGLTLESLEFGGEPIIPLQNGCRRFFHKIPESGYLTKYTDIHLVSYRWSRDQITLALASGSNVLNVHSKELAYNRSVSPGVAIREVIQDKRGYCKEVLEGSRKKSKTLKYSQIANDWKHLTVYIGGDVGDFRCLLEADIGIVIGSCPSLRKLGDHFGVKFVPLLHFLIQKQKLVKSVLRRKRVMMGCTHNWGAFSGNLYTVSTWPEIEAFILGL